MKIILTRNFSDSTTSSKTPYDEGSRKINNINKKSQESLSQARESVKPIKFKDFNYKPSEPSKKNPIPPTGESGMSSGTSIHGGDSTSNQKGIPVTSSENLTPMYTGNDSAYTFWRSGNPFVGTNFINPSTVTKGGSNIRLISDIENKGNQYNLGGNNFFNA